MLATNFRHDGSPQTRPRNLRLRIAVAFIAVSRGENARVIVLSLTNTRTCARVAYVCHDGGEVICERAALFLSLRNPRLTSVVHHRFDDVDDERRFNSALTQTFKPCPSRRRRKSEMVSRDIDIHVYINDIRNAGAHVRRTNNYVCPQPAFIYGGIVPRQVGPSTGLHRHSETTV